LKSQLLDWSATKRTIGIGGGDRLRSATLVLIETDGRRVRSLETQVVPLATESLHDVGTTASRLDLELDLKLSKSVLQFMGNLTLQPFSIDVIGLTCRVAAICDVSALARHTGVEVVAPCDVNDPKDPAYAAAIAAYLAACNQPWG
jgi:hypothetical protein